MAKKNKGEKKPEEGAAKSPKATPAEAPKEKKKEEKPKAEKKEPVDPKEKEKFTKEALDIILKGIAQPDAQKDGATFIPADWSTKYKLVLGGYKKFVQSQPEKLAVMEGPGGTFVVRKAGDTTACPAVVSNKKGGAGDWKKDLTKAWNTYCSATPKHERSMEAFVAALPQGVRNTKPETAASKSPKMSPKAAPNKSAPGEGGGKKKKGKAESEPETKKRKEPPAEEAAAEGGKKKKKKAKTE